MSKAEEKVVLSKEEYERFKSLEHELSELKRMIFGSRSERFVSTTDDNQLPLFEALGEAEKLEEKTQDINYKRTVSKEKKTPIRALLPAHLPREEEIIEPQEIEEGSKKIGEEITEILEHIPGKLFVRKIVRPKYATAKNETVIIADLPSLPIPKGNAGAGLLAYLQISKFIDHLPFYRQVQMFKREGVKLAESTINGWFKASCTLLEPLYTCLKAQVVAQSYLQADESPIPVQNSQKKGATHTGYHWVYHAPLQKMAVFDYQKSRSGKSVEEFLGDFQGELQTDGYAAYNKLVHKGITLYACMAHARRYFEKALDNDKQTAEYALTVIQSLYAIERKLAENQDQKEIRRIRQQEALPILTEWKVWLDKQQLALSPKSPIGKAVNYTLSLWSRLIKYTQNGYVLIDNNRIENLIRPLALGRKNYLFAGSHNGAQRAAMMYSFFATCKLSEVNPYKWLKDVLTRISDTKTSQLETLLPQKWSQEPT